MMLMIGAGAVGTTLATYWMRAGRVPLRLYARDKDRDAFEAIRELRVEPSLPGRPAITSARPELTSSLHLDGMRYVILCVKFSALEPLLRELGPLPSDCTLVSTLNGVQALQVLRQYYPDARIVPMSVMFNGQLLGPLHAQITTHPLVVMGTSDPVLLDSFRNSGMKVQRAAGDAAVWGKLLINLANSICALTHTTFKDLFTQMPLRRLYVGVLDEAVATLRKAGIPYRLPMPVPYVLFRGMLLHGGPLPWVDRPFQERRAAGQLSLHGVGCGTGPGHRSSPTQWRDRASRPAAGRPHARQSGHRGADRGPYRAKGAATDTGGRAGNAPCWKQSSDMSGLYSGQETT